MRTYYTLQKFVVHICHVCI